MNFRNGIQEEIVQSFKPTENEKLEGGSIHHSTITIIESEYIPALTF